MRSHATFSPVLGAIASKTQGKADYSTQRHAMYIVAVIPTLSPEFFLPLPKALASLLLRSGIQLATLSAVTLNLYFNRAEEAVTAGHGGALETASNAGAVSN